jgi:molybdenum cofactor cytidylyltransferase
MGTPGRIAAVVLAAGGSTRLGSPKQLLPIAGRPALEHVLQTVRDADIDLRYIVLGSAIAEIRANIDLRGFDVVENPAFRDGQSTSVRVAIEALPKDIAAVVFILGDQPTQRGDVIDALVTAYRQEPAPAVQPHYADGPGNPVLIDRSLFPRLLKLQGDTGARPVLRDLGNSIRRIDVAPLKRPVDIDTREDYERVLSMLQTEDRSGST